MEELLFLVAELMIMLGFLLGYVIAAAVMGAIVFLALIVIKKERE